MSFIDRLHATYVRSIEERAVLKALEEVVVHQTHYSVAGHPHVRRFEQAISKYLGKRPVVGVDSGMSALMLALRASGVGHGDEVLVPAFGFAGIPSAVCWLGARPVFVDITDDYGIDSKQIPEKITPHTKAIIVPHLFGVPLRSIIEICSVAKAHDLIVIEDVAQAFGARLLVAGNWQPAGSFGDIACCSFSSTKPFAAPGNAGAIAVTDEAMVDELHRLRFYGIESEREESVAVGVCAKLHEIHAAALLAKLPHWQYWYRYRRTLAMQYYEGLKDVATISIQAPDPAMRPIWYRYPIRTTKRGELMGALLALKPKDGWRRPVINYLVPLPEQPAYRQYADGQSYPVATRVCAEIMSPPINNYISDVEVATMIDAIRSVHT